MTLSLSELSRQFIWNEAEIHYLEMIGNTVQMDIYFVTFRQPKKTSFSKKFVDLRIRLVFKDVTLFTDDYYSPLEKILSRFKNNYICSYAEINEKGEFVIDDCLRIRCGEVEVQELPR